MRFRGIFVQVAGLVLVSGILACGWGGGTPITPAGNGSPGGGNPSTQIPPETGPFPATPPAGFDSGEGGVVDGEPLQPSGVGGHYTGVSTLEDGQQYSFELDIDVLTDDKYFVRFSPEGDDGPGVAYQGMFAMAVPNHCSVGLYTWYQDGTLEGIWTSATTGLGHEQLTPQTSGQEFTTYYVANGTREDGTTYSYQTSLYQIADGIYQHDYYMDQDIFKTVGVLNGNAFAITWPTEDCVVTLYTIGGDGTLHGIGGSMGVGSYWTETLSPAP